MRICKSLFFTLLLLFVAVFQATHTIAGENKPGPVYAGPDGKIYVKHGQSLYLRLTTSVSDQEPSYLMRNDASANPNEPVVPFLLEGHGEHTLIHPKDHKNVQARKGPHHFRIYDDAIPPASKISFSKAPRAMLGKTVVFGNPITLTVIFSDKGSGVYSSYYSVDDAASQMYIAPLQFAKEKDYVLRVHGTDNVGNVSKPKAYYYALDFTVPKTSKTVKGPRVGDILSPKATIRLKSTDNKAGVRSILYQFKGKQGVFKKAPLNMKGLEDGPHELIYGAVDRVENAEPEIVYAFYLDKIPPVTRFSVIGDQYQTEKTLHVSARSRMDLKATDNKAGVRRIRYYLAKDRRGKIYKAPFPLPAKNGPTSFSYAASDKVVNISGITKQKLTVDISHPRINPVFKGEHYYSRRIHYIRKSTKMSFKASDNLSGVQKVVHKVDQEFPVVGNEEFSIEIEGLHKMVYWAVDNVENKTAEKKARLYVDEVSPEIYHHFSVERNVPGQEIYPPKTLLYLASTDEQAGIRRVDYSINGSKKKKHPSAALPFNKTGEYTVVVDSEDNVGNQTTKTIRFTIRKF